MGSSQNHFGGAPAKKAGRIAKLMAKGKVSSSDDQEPNEAVEMNKDRAVSTAPPLLVNYFASGRSSLRI